MGTKIEISAVEVLALKKLAIVNGALLQGLTNDSARREQRALLSVLLDVAARADLANTTSQPTESQFQQGDGK